jgi:hypothetical protein
MVRRLRAGTGVRDAVRGAAVVVAAGAAGVRVCAAVLPGQPLELPADGQGHGLEVDVLPAQAQQHKQDPGQDLAVIQPLAARMISPAGHHREQRLNPFP